MEGSIVRLYLKDFVTFHEATLLPNNHMNLITGPNGTGKSSLMCALCLGLAGKPKVVGRASSVSEYIRYNAEKSTIEIELFNTKGRNHIVSRTIFRDNKSSWNIGGFACTQKEVENLTSKLNIQIDNLCQFLPQDRVQDFAKMNAQTLMENTEKCIGGLEMWENHVQLKKLGAAYLDNEKTLKSKVEHLANEEQIFSGLQSAVDKMTSKRALISKVEGLKQKQAYLLYEGAIQDAKVSEDILKRKVECVKTLVKQSKPIEIELTNAKMRLKACEDKLKSVSSVYAKHHHSSEADFELPETIHDKSKENISDYERILANEKRRLENLKDMRLQIEYMENLLQGMDEEGLKENESKLALEERTAMKEIYALQMEKQSVEMKTLNMEHQIKLLDKEMAKANDVNNLKLLQLKTKGLYEPILWFRENKDKLRGKAYEPMTMVCLCMTGRLTVTDMTECDDVSRIVRRLETLVGRILDINMKSMNMAKYLECVIPKRDLLAFVCENPEDSNFLMEELRDKLKYKVNVVTSKPNVAMSSFTRPYELQSIAKYDFYTYLSDTFSAPEAIMRYLCKNYFIHRIPIGNNSTFAKASEVPQDIKVFMTDEKKFSIRQSRYTQEIISSSCEIRAATLLKASVNEASIRECSTRSSQLKGELQNLKNVFSGFESQEQNLVENVQRVKKDRSEIKGTLSKIASTKTRIVTLRRNEEETKRKECSEEELRRKLEIANQKCAQQLVSALNKNVDYLKKFGDIIMMMKLTQSEINWAREDISSIEHDLRAITKTIKEAEKEERASHEIFDEARKHATRYLTQVEELSQVKYKSKEFPNLLKTFARFPDSLEEIEREIHVTQTKAELLGHSDATVVKEYERRQTTITAMRKVIDQLNADQKKSSEEIEVLRSSWMPFVNDLIKKLDKTFGDLLSRINYVGEVILVRGQSDYDFSNYGFKIQVKFRQEGALQELNQFRQSGGERAVAIAVYLMSLQELTSVPFRCVDEINQGMDEFHEAAVFRLLSDIVSKTGGAQYFLFTPKVLRSLTFSESLLYTCVINGEVENIEVDCRKIAKLRKAKESKKMHCK